MNMNSQLRYKVFIPPFLILITAVLASFVNLESFLTVTTAINGWILDTFGWLFSAGAFFMVVTCVVVFFSPLGKVTIGGNNAKPLLNKWRWGSITICTTTAAGMLFWATAEPLFHLYSPPESLGITPGSREAAEFSLSTMYMHWSFTPFVLYAVPALSFALAFYNLSQRFSISASLQPLFGRRCSQSVGGIVDSISMFALVAGMASSLGTGALVLSSGISNITGLLDGAFLLGIVIALIMVSFVASSVSGLHKGIARLSALNTVIFALIALIAFIFGPTQTIVTNGAHALVDYTSEFITRSFSLNLDPSDNWDKSWTVFYWANWLAWAPIVALFLGKIAKGHTVRAFIVVNIVIPASFSLVWMAIFSGMILELDLSQNGAFYAILNENGAGAVVYSLLEQLPASRVLIGMFIFIAFLAYVTAADSNTEAISSLCLDRQGISEESNPLKSKLKILWGSIIALIAWFMTAFSGIDGIKMMSNLGGLPALFVVLAMNASLIIWVVKSYKPSTETIQSQKATNLIS